MEQFGALKTKTQYYLLNNLDISSLQLLCGKRGINTHGIDKKYDGILMFIQWYNNINFKKATGIRGLIVCDKGPRKHMEDCHVIHSNNGISIMVYLMDMVVTIYQRDFVKVVLTFYFLIL